MPANTTTYYYNSYRTYTVTQKTETFCSCPYVHHISGMLSQSWCLGLETVSRRTNISFSTSCLGLVSDKVLNISVSSRSRTERSRAHPCHVLTNFQNCFTETLGSKSATRKRGRAQRKGRPTWVVRYCGNIGSLIFSVAWSTLPSLAALGMRNALAAAACYR